MKYYIILILNFVLLMAIACQSPGSKPFSIKSELSKQTIADTFKLDSVYELIIPFDKKHILLKPYANSFFHKSLPIYLSFEREMLHVKSENLDTLISGLQYSVYENGGSFLFDLYEGNSYYLKNATLFCENDLGTFELIENSWIPIDCSIKKINIDRIEFENESIQYGADFFTVFKIKKIKSSSQNLDFLQSTYIPVKYSKKFKKNVGSDVSLELYIEKPNSELNHEYHGFFVR